MKQMKTVTIDGNEAAAHVAYAMSEVAAIYPITPSSSMGEYCDEWASHGRKNIFGQTLKVSEMQSEAGAAGAAHGVLVSGSLATTFTASQGLLLMIPNMYKISGELLPAVFHVSARSLSTHALSIFGDHSDVMAVRQTGFGLIASASVQEVMDLGLVAHLASIKASLPILHFFDGFRTSLEIQKIELIDYSDMAGLVDFDAVEKFRSRALNPEHPHMRGTAQNPDIFFQQREASNPFYENFASIVEEAMDQVGKLTGRNYKLFDYVGDPEAEKVLVAMASGCDTIEETVNYLCGQGEKVGAVKVRLYRPFSPEHFLNALPSSVKKISALDRTKEPGSIGEPLYEDICTVFEEKGDSTMILGGRYGLSSKDFTPAMVKAVFDNMDSSKPKNHFTVGINDDVTHKSLEIGPEIDTSPKGTVRCKFWGLGADGTVGANKEAIKIIGDNTDMYAQGFFAYDAKKSGGLTVSHLRFSPHKIQSPYLLTNADFIACHNPVYVNKYEVLDGIREGGTFLLNSPWDKHEMEDRLPNRLKRIIAQKHLNFYNIDAIKIAEEIGLGRRYNMILQAAFFYISKVIPPDQVFGYIKDGIRKAYGKKGEKIVQMNINAVDRAAEALEKIDIPSSWANAGLEEADKEGREKSDYIHQIMSPMLAQQGDKLPVSVFTPDGTFPTGTTKYEKRGVAINVPEWQSENCIQCTFCAFGCPHAAIRPVLARPEDIKDAPESFETVEARGKDLKGLRYRIQVNTEDCTGCGVCAQVCPAKDKALVMKPIATQTEKEISNYNFAESLPILDDLIPPTSVKGSQLKQPLFEFSGACPGCGETPYVKIITQLFGDRMIILNATGCSSIYGGTPPTCPYTVNREGHGPAWASGLFEDNAEYAYGVVLGVNQRRDKLADLIREAMGQEIDQKLKDAFAGWLKAKDDAEESKKYAKDIKEILSGNIDKYKGKALKILKNIQGMGDHLVKKSIWGFGGDGWAYDIGYGGLDHVLAQGQDINLLVLDTEVYSNTGGQASKSTPLGAVAKYTAAGKPIRKKDLGKISMTYGYIYVASVALGADRNQLMKAITEAESYPGPSIIIAYSPCINHGLDMSKSQEEQKKAVERGYWIMYRYNPLREKEEKNPFILDSKEPKGDFREFLEGEVRYSSLNRTFPDRAKELFQKAEEEMRKRYESYKQMAGK